MTSSPRKFSEKIALHAQRQAEGNAAFDKIMKDVSNINREPPAPIYGIRSPIQLQSNQLGGSLPNVAMMDPAAFHQVMPRHEEMRTQPFGRSAGLVCRRVYQKKHLDNTPYTQHYLTPPSETGWRRTHSDSSLHITAMGGGDTSYPAPQTAPVRPRGVQMFSDFDQGVMDGDCKTGLWDKKLQNRPKSCEVPGINIYPSEQDTGTVPIPIQNTGSLPDLTNIHIPPPLMTPLDNDDQTMYNHSSTNNLQANTVQILGMSQSSSSQQTHSPHSPQPCSPQMSPAISPQIQRRNKTNPVAISLGHRNQGHVQMQDSGGMVMDQNVPKYQVFQNQPPQSPQHSSNILSLDKSGIQQYRDVSSVGPTTSCSSPSSPVSNPNLSPAASPGPPGSVGCNPALSDAYSQRILQQQFEDFTMVGDHSPTHQPSQYQFQGFLDQNYFTGNQQPYHHNMNKVPPPAYHQPFPQYPQVNNIPSIILSGVDSQDMAKDIHSAIVSYDHEALFSAEDSLKLDPLECEDFQMLLENDPVTDQTTEDSFRADGMGGLYK